MASMTAYTQTIRISDAQFRQLNHRAHASDQSVEEYAENLLERVLKQPATKVDADRSEQQLNALSDAALWQIFNTTLPDEHWERYETLLHSNNTRELTISERSQLQMLRDDADLLMVQRAQAAKLLHNRGHSIPNPQLPMDE